MFRKYPYWGWLLFSLILWCASAYDLQLHRQGLSPANLVKSVSNDLHRREVAFSDLGDNKELIEGLFRGTITEQGSEQLCALPFYIYAYRNDTLKYWNTNAIIPPNNDSARSRPLLLRSDKGVFVEEYIDIPAPSGKNTLIVLFPVVISYPLENDYLRSHFVASDDIPPRTRIYAPGDNNIPKGSIPVTLHKGKVIFSLSIDPSDVQKWMPDTLFIVLLIASLLTTVLWIQLMIISLARKRSPMVGFIATVSVIFVIRGLLYAYGLPFNLDTFTFFSPLLYASSAYLSSFGDLFINTLLLIWVVIYITRHTPYKTYFVSVRNAGLRYVIAIALIIGLILYVLLFVGLIRSLILDSRISFDISHFYSINIYTILGMLAIGIITGISAMVIYLFNIQLNVLQGNKWIKYMLAAITGVICLFTSGYAGDLFYWSLLVWLLLFITLLDVPRLALVSDLFEPHMIFWALFIAAFSTGILQYFNHLKEEESRITYVKLQLTPSRDEPAEYAFDKAADSLSHSRAIKDFFYDPSLAGRKALNHLLATQYLSGSALSKYDQYIYLFDARGNGLFNSDSTDYNTLLDEKNEASSTGSPNLFYKESILDRNYYISHIKVYNDTVNKIIGYVVIDMTPKKQANETVNSELLQPAFSKDRNTEYAYAVYINNKLISQVNDYPFTTYLNSDTLQDQHYEFYNNNGISELHYKIADKRTIVVVHYHSETIELITLFSYLFGMQVFLAVIILVYQLFLSYFTSSALSGRFIKFTLRRRVHLSMLGVVLLSFIIIGVVTIYFFTIQYRNSNQDKLQSVLRATKQSVQNYLKKYHAYDSDNIFDSVSRSGPFKEYISTLANGQKIDINIYDDNGILFNTSEDDIYNKGLLSNHMRPEAYFQLHTLENSIVIQNEKIAALSYLSGYEPLRNERGAALGYINIPLFSSEKDLNFQISNIVVTLINLYAFIFLISSIVTVGITRWITRTFNVIIEQFAQLNLQRNERITWPYDDEIGLLVREYNKMVNKVEENAALLAQSERETAWREMARQVAHEIKNPLTPMKLNIQYLQQAMQNDNPNIKELASRVSNSIIEQIDNLSYIASEFSNFAKMPEARPEDLDLGTLLNKAVELYLNEPNIRVSVSEPQEDLYVFADKSQLLRVFTNLLENAKQAIPADANGDIDIMLKKEDGHVIITITDNGRGIPDDIVKKIFQPYFTTKTSGTGLGLAMTRKIIEFWKGEIWFETKEGEGTTFFIKLPLATTT